MINKQSYQIQGMKQDNLVGTGYSTKFAHEIMNMRLNTVGDYTTASWTTEKGTKQIKVQPMPNEGNSIAYSWLSANEIENFQPIGQANINDEWILFGVLEDDSVILNLHYNKDASNNEYLYGRILFRGNLNFDVEHPIETITFYENEKLQKVYWTDGKNQPRVINIKGAENIEEGFSSDVTTQFDFIQEVSLGEDVEITKDQSGAGLFPPGTVKYAITYYKKYGQETNIVYDSPLFYPILGERGCSPDELSGDSFYIKVNNIDTTHGFDYIRLYSIVRSTNGATPIVRIVEDKPINSNIDHVVFHDTNTTGQVIDPSLLYFIGGKEIIAHTFDQKDNTLFLGNIKLTQKSVTNILDSEDLVTLRYNHHINFDGYKELRLRKAIHVGADDPRNVQDYAVYQYYNELNQADRVQYDRKVNGDSFQVKSFKYGETYRFGIQFQDNKGAWSEVVFLEDAVNNHAPTGFSYTGICQIAKAKYTLDGTLKNKLYNNKYRKARLVCCYPTNADRTILAQGVLAPTVYNKMERDSHAPDVMSSWFFRPKELSGAPDDKKDRILPYQHNALLATSDKNNSEIQSIVTNNPNSNGSYMVDNRVLTFHSPEIEFDESLRTLDLSNCTVNLVGCVPIQSYASKYYVDADPVFMTLTGRKGRGFIDKLSYQPLQQYVVDDTTKYYGSHDLNCGYWDDGDVYNWRHDGRYSNVQFPLYPFQRKGSLNTYVVDKTLQVSTYGDNEVTGIEYEVTQSAKLNSKVFANIAYSSFNKYAKSNDNFISYPLSICGFNIFDSSEVLPIQINTNLNNNTNNDKLIYYGNVDTIVPITVGTSNSNGENSALYDIYKRTSSTNPNQYARFFGDYKINVRRETSEGIIREWSEGSEGSVTGVGMVSSDPIPMRFKSTPHGVFYTNTLVSGTSRSESSIPSEFNSSNFPYLYLAELRRNVDTETRFGGNPLTNPSVQNVYIPCGPAEELSDDSLDIILDGYEGDTYYMRYDNLKTYPFATDDVNQIVEILSFMVETRINLDGRYDKNRGLLDNTNISNTNFNLLNKSYTQDNNIFNFLTLDKLSSELDRFVNQISWTKTKVSGEDIDSWTNITLASTADAEGTLGSISKILNFNDKLLLFQDHGISTIGFNENTAISTENGVPLELAKTGKYTGLNYLTKEIGCQNKWSISKSKNGLFWIDDSRQELLTFGENIQSLSTINGFDAFMIKQLPSVFKPWNPTDFDNFVTYYDKLSNDVYYINKNTCLAWNEQTGTFTSFYNYENVPYMMNVGQHSLMWKKGVWAARELTEPDTESDNDIEKEVYSKFFGDTKDYWMTLVCDGMTDKGSAFPADKVFNNIEYRADIYNLDGNNANYATSVFNKKHVWNGYQNSTEVDLDGERKFNTWRVQLPRHYGTRDRIRNPFCYIKLKQDNTYSEVKQTDRMILHDLAVYFDMR